LKLSGSDIVIECLKEQNVDTIFGFPGGAVLNIYDSLYRRGEGINHILTTHEQGAAHAADGYARATGKTGVCMATSGPGATNLVTGIATAYMDSVPVVAITGQVHSSLIGKDSFQEVDITGVTMPITKHNFLVKDVEKLAEHIAGSENVFVTLMNEKAKELAMNNTYFLDCSGLTDEGHYSTAHDIAIMARELITKYPSIYEYTTIKRDTFRSGTFGLDNTNRLIGKYRGMTGLKTGVTGASGYCLAATASRDGMDLISVVLGVESNDMRFTEAAKILDYGFSNYEIVNINKKGVCAGNINVKKGLEVSVPVAYENDKSLLLKRGLKDKIKEEIRLPDYINAPVNIGDKAGEAVVTLENDVILKIPLVTMEEVKKATWLKIFWRLTTHWFCLARN
jgi:hypothetical protein